MFTVNGEEQETVDENTPYGEYDSTRSRVTLQTLTTLFGAYLEAR
jgi:hypothetical protein